MKTRIEAMDSWKMHNCWHGLTAFGSHFGNALSKWRLSRTNGVVTCEFVEHLQLITITSREARQMEGWQVLANCTDVVCEHEPGPRPGCR